MPEIEFTPRVKGTPRGSRNEKLYEAGIMPGEHKRLLKGFETALSGKKEGELIFQRVLELVGISRSSALRMIKSLEKHGYLKYEAKTREHKVYVEILKGVE